MLTRNKAVLDGALTVAEHSHAAALLLAGGDSSEAAYLKQRMRKGLRLILAPLPGTDADGDGDLVPLPPLRLRRRGRAKIALLEGLAAGLVHPGERLVVISGAASSNGHGQELDTVALVEVPRTAPADGSADPLARLRDGLDPAVFDHLLGVCVRLGHEGREGQPVGLLVTLGDHDAVMSKSRPLVLNPFQGHPERVRDLMQGSARRALQEFSGMDGAVVVRSDGVILAAGRHLHAVAGADRVPEGLGTRHRAAAGITDTTRCVAFVVSQTTGATRVFSGGRIILTIGRDD